MAALHFPPQLTPSKPTLPRVFVWLLQTYGDDTTPMGFCPRCIYNAVDQMRLGWSRALPVVDWSMFTGTTILNLPALSDTAAFRDLGVVHIRLSSPSDPGVPGSTTSHIYLSYRAAKNHDISLPDKYSMATSVHGFNGETWLLAWPKTTQAYVNTANKMVVRQDAGDASSARGTLCKWVTAQSECGTFTTFVRSSISAASVEAPVDLEAYYGTHTRGPAGKNATAAVVDITPVDVTAASADATAFPTIAVSEAASGVPVAGVDTSATPAEVAAAEQP